LKIIQIVENLDKGAVENWLVRIFIHSRKSRPEWHWTFYCILGKPGRLDEIVRSAGGEIIYSPVTVSQKVTFLKHLRQILKRGHYDILHSHHDYLSGFYLLSSFGIGFKKRFLQIHNTDKALPVGSQRLNKMLLGPMRLIGYHFSDYIIGISQDTLIEFTGKIRHTKPKTRLLYYGIDLDSFERERDPEILRTKLELPSDAKLLLFAGRLNEYKNPLFVVDILREMLKERSDVYALFVGSGDLQPEIKRKSDEFGIADHVRILGWSDDIAGLMKSADVFVFPRVEYPREGLGLVVVEAQAAGLPMAISHAIVKDAIVIPELANYIPLDLGPAAWAKKISQVLSDEAGINRVEALRKMKASAFSLDIATENLIALYEE